MCVMTLMDKVRALPTRRDGIGRTVVGLADVLRLLETVEPQQENMELRERVKALEAGMAAILFSPYTSIPDEMRNSAHALLSSASSEPTLTPPDGAPKDGGYWQ